jgi:calcineurin-like phosphoesterase family protein
MRGANAPRMLNRMETWFTADLHLGHGNIIKYSNRPFMTTEEIERAQVDSRGSWTVSPETIAKHDHELLEAINSRVGERDTLWILGDFCFRDFEKAKMYRSRVRCKHVHLIWGNHDAPKLESLFERTFDQGMIKIDGQRIWLNHYPMRSWDGSFHGAWHLYGHVHGRLAAQDENTAFTLTRDVGVDACEYRPISFTELREWMQPRVALFEERKAAFVAGETDQFVE